MEFDSSSGREPTASRGLRVSRRSQTAAGYAWISPWLVGCGAFLLLAMILGKRVVAGATFTLAASVGAALITAGAMVLPRLPWTSLGALALIPVVVRLPLPEKSPAWIQAIVASLYALAPAAGACALAWQSSRVA